MKKIISGFIVGTMVLLTVLVLFNKTTVSTYSMPDENIVFAEAFIDVLCKNDYKKVEPLLTEDAKHSYPPQEIELVATLLNKIRTKELVDCRTSTSEAGKTATLTYKLYLVDDDFINRNRPIFFTIDIKGTDATDKRVAGLRFALKY